MRKALLPMLLVAACAAHAQVDEAIPRDLIEQRIEIAAERLGDNADVDLTNLFEVLVDRYRDPLDLNRASAEELAELNLLNDVQIGALLAHVDRTGRMLSLYELQTINGFDPATIALIRPFVTVREDAGRSSASLKEILKNGDHELWVRSIYGLEKRRGFAWENGGLGRDYYDPDGDPLPDYGDPAVLDSLRRNNRLYLGPSYKLYTRYRFRYRQNISFGITAEKDEGEEFFTGTQPDGFDFYSAHLFLRNMGRVKAVAVGDFQAQFGQGLTYWSGLAFASKSSFTMNIKRNATGLSPYTSVNENLFLRGGGATIDLGGNLELTAFYSDRALDANVSGVDTLESGVQNETFTSFQEDGFHRTYRELEKKDAIHEQSFGGHLRYKRRSWSVGATAVRSTFDTELNRNLQPYNQFEFNGQDVTNVGVDWNVLRRNATWFGEVARTANGGMAWLTGVLVALDRSVSLSLLYRDYQRDFQDIYSVGFSEGGRATNERGLYTGIEVRPSREWSFNAYFDQWRFPWLRYQTDAPSSGYETLGQVTWRPQRGFELYVRARFQKRQRNTRDDVPGVDPLVDVDQSNYRFNATYKVSESVSLRTRVEAVDYRRTNEPVEHGFIIYQDLVHRPLRSKVEITLRAALFETDSYDARVYAYESDLIGVFSIPPYYGRGMRWYAMLRFKPLRRVDVWLRYGAWLYNDQDRISSGLQEIAGDRRSDLKMQVRVRF
ncbi:MAG TPA: helix-hairpin-helix domain-containing protein [Flavobacteriales bacterium]|nr:helix-hairpin-helix domain-containing protein [Flavobacteriales bacterium]